MNTRKTKTGAAAIGAGALIVTWFSAASAMTVPRIEDATTLKECGTCHMVYPPQLLPQRSWDALMSHLENHFGDSAALEEATRIDILAYLLANAADAPDGKRDLRVLRGVKAGDTPERITALPWWLGRHGEVNLTKIKATPIKSAANCIACHAGADKGSFTE